MRIILKILACLLIVISSVLKWIGRFAASMAQWIFHLFAWLLAVLAVVLLAFGEITTQQLIQLMAFSFLFFVVPHIVGGCTRWATRVNEKLTAYVRT